MKLEYLFIFIICTILTSSFVIAEGNVIKVDFHLVNVTEPSEVPKIQREMAVSAMSDKYLEEIASSHIKEKVGRDYFEEHFSFKEVDQRKFVTYVKYDFNYDENDIAMHVAYDPEKEKIVPEMSSFLSKSMKVDFDKSHAELKADVMGLPKSREVMLVYDSNHDTLAWKVLWEHEPTKEEMANNTIKGYLFDAGGGDILETYKYYFELIGTPPDRQEETGTNFIKKLWNFIIGLFG